MLLNNIELAPLLNINVIRQRSMEWNGMEKKVHKTLLMGRKGEIVLNGNAMEHVKSHR